MSSFHFPPTGRRSFLANAPRFLTLGAVLQSRLLRAKEAELPMLSGQIGAAHPHAAGKMEAMRNLPELWRVVGITESDAGRRAALPTHKIFGGIPILEEEALLGMPAVRAIAVETAIGDSTATALRVLRAGKHVHLDKPGGFDHPAFSAMRLEAEERKLALQMGYMLRYNPAFELLFTAVKEGWLGEITEIDCSMGKFADAGTRAQLKSQPGGAMFEIAGHLIDVVVALLGKPQRVDAFSTPAQSDGFPDNQLAVLVYPKATACVRTNFVDPFGGLRRRFNVTGTEGSFEITPLESGQLSLSLSRDCGGYKKGVQSVRLNVPRGRYDAEFVDLARVVRGEKTLAWGAAHDIAVHETILRAAGFWKGV
jgi:predicted dehydrogenase